VNRNNVIWDGLRQARVCPACRDIKPAELVDLLPFIAQVDVPRPDPSASQVRFVYRLVGTAGVHYIGKELTRQPAGTGVKAGELAAVLRRYQFVAVKKLPYYHKAQLREESNDYSQVGRIMLPLSADGERVDMIMSLVHWVGAA
jgi:hypothetical protein